MYAARSLPSAAALPGSAAGAGGGTSLGGDYAARPMIPATSGWRVLGVDTGPATALLDRGLDLLSSLADDPRPVLRWYRACEPAVVLGRGQGDLRLQPVDGLEIASRHSGGGAVLLDRYVLNLDVLVPDGHPWLAGPDLGRVFEHVGSAWVAALTHLGVADVRRYEGPSTARRRGTPRERLLAAVCYATLGRGEVLAGGRKIVGLSQRRRRPGALVQCGLLERWAPGPLLTALGADADDPEIERAAVGLEEVLQRAVPDAAVRGAVEQAFADAVAAPRE